MRSTAEPSPAGTWVFTAPQWSLEHQRSDLDFTRISCVYFQMSFPESTVEWGAPSRARI